MINLKAYYELCKPNVVLTMLVTALVGSLLASEVSYINFELILTSLIGIGLCACSAAAINQVIDRKIDANILRTQERIEKILGLKVNILNKKNNSGKISIEYKDLDQFELISNLLTKH